MKAFEERNDEEEVEGRKTGVERNPALFAAVQRKWLPQEVSPPVWIMDC